jgi:hypothetical protein
LICKANKQAAHEVMSNARPLIIGLKTSHLDTSTSLEHVYPSIVCTHNIPDVTYIDQV